GAVLGVVLGSAKAHPIIGRPVSNRPDDPGASVRRVWLIPEGEAICGRHRPLEVAGTGSGWGAGVAAIYSGGRFLREMDVDSRESDRGRRRALRQAPGVLAGAAARDPRAGGAPAPGGW